MTDTPSTVVRTLYSALEAGAHGEELRALFTADATTTEHPSRLKPVGATADLEQMLSATTAGTGLLAWQRYDIRDAFDVGETAIVRSTWTGEIATDAGPFRPASSPVFSC